MNIGIIGTGGMAFQKLHYPVFQQLADKFKIVAISDVDLHKRGLLDYKTGIEPQ